MRNYKKNCDFCTAQKSIEKDSNKYMSDKNKVLITAALPYANGPLHIGHLAGCYLPSDIYARYQRAQGRKVLYICGSDEHGVPITIRAMREGITPQQVVDKYHNLLKDTFEKMDISFDIYHRTSAENHKHLAQDFFKNLYDKGIFEEKISSQYYDVKENTFLADRYITGTCPYCENTNAYGDQCEKCGSTLSPEQLLNPKSALSDSELIKKDTKHWYFPLDKYEDFLKEWIIDGKKDIWKNTVYGQCKSWIDGGLQPRAMTRDSHWGVPVPVEGADGKVLYVWFDAPIGYISATQALMPDHWESYWKSEDTKLVHFIGKDNIVFHCIIFPSMLKAHGDYILPDNVPANEFLNIEGQKVSTSRNWAVWVDEFVNAYPELKDAMRFVLTANAPENKDNDFTWKDFQNKTNSELVDILGNFINRAIVLTHKLTNGKVPKYHTEIEDQLDADLVEAIKQSKDEISNNLDKYKFRDALFAVINLARKGNKYLQEKEPWKWAKKVDEDQNAQSIIENTMYNCLQLTANLAIYLQPFLPSTSQKIRHLLKVVDKITEWQNAGNPHLLNTGYPVRPPELLFRKIEDEEINAWIQKLHEQSIQNAADNNKSNDNEEKTVAPLLDTIQIEDFNKIDLRVGEIIEAIKVPKADKLLQLTVDMGFEKRTILSGIALSFKPEDVIGKKVTVVANLAPRKMRGVESHGMILMTENSDGQLVFVNPDPAAHNGSPVK